MVCDWGYVNRDAFRYSAPAGRCFSAGEIDLPADGTCMNHCGDESLSTLPYNAVGQSHSYRAPGGNRLSGKPLRGAVFQPEVNPRHGINPPADKIS